MKESVSGRVVLHEELTLGSRCVHVSDSELFEIHLSKNLVMKLPSGDTGDAQLTSIVRKSMLHNRIHNIQRDLQNHLDRRAYKLIRMPC